MMLLDLTYLIGLLCGVQGLPLVNRLSGRPDHVVHYHNDGGVNQAHIHIKRGFDIPETVTNRHPSKNQLTGRHDSQQFRGSHSQRQVDVQSLISQYRNLHNVNHDNHRHIDRHGHDQLSSGIMSQTKGKGHIGSVRTQLRQLIAKSETIPGPSSMRLDNYTPPPHPTTQHSGLITKRGIAEIGTFSTNLRTPPPRAYVENRFRLRVWNTSTNLEAKTVPPFAFQSGHLHTGQRTVSTRSPFPSTNPTVTSKVPVGSSTNDTVQTVVDAADVNRLKGNQKNETLAKLGKAEVVKLEGIHIMFSNTEQNASADIPTIHLTAALGGGNQSQHNISTATSKQPGVPSFTDTIVGTAVIRNGHLYLVVYPFGNKKEVNIKMSNETLKLNGNNTQTNISNEEHHYLPRNKPLPLPSNKEGFVKKEQVTFTPEPITNEKSTSMEFKTSLKTTTAEAETTTSNPNRVMSMDVNHHNTQNHAQGERGQTSIHSTTTSPLQPTTAMFFPEFDALFNGHGHHDHPTMDHSNHGHAFNDHHGHTAQTMDILPSVERFESPWNALNLTDVFPYPKIKTHFDKNSDDDNDIKVVPFVANATDPFAKIQHILASLADQVKNNSSTDASGGTFNFEIKLRGDSSSTDQGNQYEQTTTVPVNENTSEEKTTIESWVTKYRERETSTPSLNFVSDMQQALFEESRTSVKTRQSSAPRLTTKLKASTIIKATKAPNYVQTMIPGNSLLDEYMNDFNSNISKFQPFTRPAISDIMLTSVILNRQRIKSSTPLKNKTVPERTPFGPSVVSPFSERNVTNLSKTNFAEEANVSVSIRSQKTDAEASPTNANEHRVTQHHVDQIISETYANKLSDHGKSTVPANTKRTLFASFEPPYVSLNASSKTTASGLSPDSSKENLPNSRHSKLRSAANGRTISLADILKDMNQIQLQRIQSFDVLNTHPLLSEVQQPQTRKTPAQNLPGPPKRPSLRESIINRPLSLGIQDNSRINAPPRAQTYNRWEVPRQVYHQHHQQHQQNQQQLGRLPTIIRHEPHPVSSNIRRSNERTSSVVHNNNNNNVMQDSWNDPFNLNSAMDAMLVLSVDDILADHATLHGAIVLANRESSSSSSSSSSSNR